MKKTDCIRCLCRNGGFHGSLRKPETGSRLHPDADFHNPFVFCEALKDAKKLAGVSLSLPENAPDWAPEITIQATQTGMIEIVYHGNDNELWIRKATGT